MKYFFFLILIIFLSSAENYGQTNKKMQTSINGIWSGKHIMMEISDDNTSIEYDCANGKISKKFILDKNKNFNIIGEYTQEMGGPVRMNDQPKSIKAIYTGQINGKKMSLTVRRKDNNKLIGKFTLYFGREPDLVKCR